MVGELLVFVVVLIFYCILALFGMLPEQRARRRAERLSRATERKAAEDERASREHHRRWRDEAAQQMFDGMAGFADETEAQAVLGGRGGRKSPLDGRKFR